MLTHQITYAATSKTLATFAMNSDSANTCGIKKYSTGMNVLTVVRPLDPSTESCELKISTNDYTLAGTHTINLVVSFDDTRWPGTLT